MESATVWNGSCDHVDAVIRSADRIHCPRTSATAWMYDRLDTLFAEAAERFGLSVAPMFEDFQIVRYGVGGHFQTWHSDAGADKYWQRQISLSAELSDARDYDGGLLEIAPSPGERRTLPRGGARLFPSRAIHRVTPVTRGLRYSLVAWTGFPEAPSP